MSTLKTQYKNWLLKNPNSQLTYVEWFGKFNEIHNLPNDMSNWDVTLNDGLEDEPSISDDFQIGLDGAYEHTDDMKQQEKAEKYAEGYRCPATNINEYCKHDIISAYNTGYNQCQEDMAKKYTEEDMLNCWNTLMVAMTSKNPVFFKDYINSLNKQDNEHI